MKWRLLILLLTILLLSYTGSFAAQAKPSGGLPGQNREGTSCTEIDTAGITVPQDFFIVYTSGDSHGDRPGLRTRIEVNANGVVKYFRDNWKGGSRQLPLKQREISSDEVKKVYAKVVGCNFFDLKEHYRDPRIMGGFSSYISVTASGKSHGVSVTQMSVKEFDAIVKTLFDAAGVPAITKRSGGK